MGKFVKANENNTTVQNYFKSTKVEDIKCMRLVFEHLLFNRKYLQERNKEWGVNKIIKIGRLPYTAHVLELNMEARYW